MCLYLYINIYLLFLSSFQTKKSGLTKLAMTRLSRDMVSVETIPWLVLIILTVNALGVCVHVYIHTAHLF